MSKDDIILNDNYWDCECKYNFIRNSEEHRCKICLALQDDQPSSRQNEIDKLIEEMVTHGIVHVRIELIDYINSTYVRRILIDLLDEAKVHFDDKEINRVFDEVVDFWKNAIISSKEA